MNNKFKGKELALKLGEFRNERIELANRLYNIENSLSYSIFISQRQIL